MTPLEEAREELAREKTRLEIVCCQRDALMDAVDMMLEFDTPLRIARVMLVTERLIKELGGQPLGWGSRLAAKGYPLMGPLDA